MRYAIAALLACAAVPAFAQETPAPVVSSACQAPTPPALVTVEMPPKPVDPSCAGPNGNISKCSRKQVADFNASVDTYNNALGPANEKLSAYVQTLNSYSLAATKYVNCEIKRVNDLLK